MKVCILGRGKVGRCLHKALRKSGTSSLLVPSTSLPERAIKGGGMVFVLAVPDGQIQALAQRLSPLLVARDVVIHCSGSRDPEELSICRRRGAFVAAMHPMVSFASRHKRPTLHGTTFVARGDAQALRRARKLADAVGAHYLAGPAGTPAYHAASAILANGGVALSALAVRTLVELGMNARLAERACAGLLRSVADNLEHVGLPAALTGPIVRGDADTVRDHIRALATLDASLAASYVALGPLVLDCAVAAGLSSEDEKRVLLALSVDTTSTGRRAPQRRR